MKIRINYDVINEILNVKEDFGVMKIVRNHGKRWVMANLPIYTTFDLAITGGNIQRTLFYLVLQAYINFFPKWLNGKMHDRDVYYERARERLMKLVSQLNDINVDTSYYRLLRSEVYEKQYYIEFTDHLPRLLEEKYILVPCYDPYSSDHEDKDVSIVQEHVVGTKEYTLSIGTPRKQYRLTPAKAGNL